MGSVGIVGSGHDGSDLPLLVVFTDDGPETSFGELVFCRDMKKLDREKV